MTLKMPDYPAFFMAAIRSCVNVLTPLFSLLLPVGYLKQIASAPGIGRPATKAVLTNAQAFPGKMKRGVGRKVVEKGFILSVFI
ncbi:hypothetical protein CYR40_18990 [Chimaeribacter arupi]|uniref:hypothetical protein n=1 Tax=Chimaeribacter arupi TaxID=2060066 RepID=UPI000C7A7F73|nr:hypothetical protein [Chimaeribacter arupi]PLR42836.1 hypothetical protein CYR40_18990 [Chimaeribacter arupi]